MSKQQHALLIQPPLFPKECPVERVEFGGFPCSYCHGNGWFWGVDEYMRYCVTKEFKTAASIEEAVEWMDQLMN